MNGEYFWNYFFKWNNKNASTYTYVHIVNFTTTTQQQKQSINHPLFILFYHLIRLINVVFVIDSFSLDLSRIQERFQRRMERKRGSSVASESKDSNTENGRWCCIFIGGSVDLKLAFFTTKKSKFEIQSLPMVVVPNASVINMSILNIFIPGLQFQIETRHF